MSRAYRISVRECINRVIRAEDRVSTQLEILEVLPPEQMAELLAQELEKLGFERDGSLLVRERDGVRATVDVATGTVTVHAEGAAEVDLQAERTGWSGDEQGAGARHAREQLRKEVQKDLEGKAEQRRGKLQSQITDKLEAQLGELRRELNQVVNRVTAEALKQKAAQLGQIKELTQEPGGNMTIVIEV